VPVADVKREVTPHGNACRERHETAAIAKDVVAVKLARGVVIFEAHIIAVECPASDSGKVAFLIRDAAISSVMLDEALLALPSIGVNAVNGAIRIGVGNVISLKALEAGEFGDPIREERYDGGLGRGLGCGQARCDQKYGASEEKAKHAADFVSGVLGCQTLDAVHIHKLSS